MAGVEKIGRALEQAIAEVSSPCKTRRKQSGNSVRNVASEPSGV